MRYENYGRQTKQVNDDDKWVRFYFDAVEDPKESNLQQRPVFKEMEFCEIRFIGHSDRTQVAPAHEPAFMIRAEHQHLAERAGVTVGHLTYAQRFPEHYENFLKKEHSPSIGTPLSALSWLPRTRIKEYEVQNVETVEQLAALRENAMSKFGAMTRSDVEKAQIYLGHASEAAVVEKALAEKREVEAKLASLEAKMNELLARSDAKAKAQEVIEDDPATWPDDVLREYMAKVGFPQHHRAGREKLIKAVQDFMRDQAEYAALEASVA